MDISSCTLRSWLFYWWMTQKWFPSLTFRNIETLFADDLKIIKSFPQGLNIGRKDVVSTSHCSHPNNIEYEMAFKWCLLQETTDKAWSRLFKQQDDELRKVEAKVKPK
ncbi:unnamed protein product [Lupinus luteus]|uniref:Uncharacterized protein n=1 Tax=Lupinus luteus TaxID=3873 RepID=A0AAV1WWV6_LUPLU